MRVEHRACIFDIETAPDERLVPLALKVAQARAEAKAKRWARSGSGSRAQFRSEAEGSGGAPEADVLGEMSLSPVFGRIVAVGILYWDEDEPQIWLGPDERRLLQAFWEAVEGCELFVSWNGLAFDLPWLYVRSMVQGVSPTAWISAARYRWPGESNHLDLFALLTDWRGNRTKHLKLDLATVCQALGVKPPEGDGAEVPKLWRRRDYEAIARHLASDLRATKGIWEALGQPGLVPQWTPF